ncbi:unnamed protein product [Orchesella dallaii]|uniref:Cytochrome P450 n=1 Tax=Orchesella dallaii TaxID=48710 RepID=A0ABP1RAK6_9HEXA
MFIVFSLGVVFIAVFVYYVYSIQFSSRGLPPGPNMWPFGLGVLPSALIRKPVFNISKLRPWEYFDLWYKDYGELYSVQAGNFYSVVVASHEIMTELANAEEYSIKVSHELFTYPRTFNKELGLIFVSNPEIWVEMRKFTQRTLREFGFGKRHTMQSAIEAEVQQLLQEFQERIESSDRKGVVSIRTIFVLSVLNVLWCMVAGKRYDRNDPTLVEMMERNFSMTKSTTFIEPVQAIAPGLKKSFPWLVGEDMRLKVFQECHEFTRSLIEERKQEGLYLTEPQSYLDVFLRKIYENKENSKSIYDEEQLQSMLADLLQTGSTTTNGTLNYGLLFLTLNPEVQRKCQEEIDRVVPQHLIPSVEDIERMPYFQAFILETHRCACVVPNPIPRLVPKDWNYRGYKIPKGTFIISNHYSVHMSKQYWGDPEVFRPERFINEKGEFVPDKRVVHFGYGKRICIGISLVNSVVPIFLSSLLQKFNFSVVPGTKPPSTEPEIGVSLSPSEFSVLAEKR